MQRNMFHMRPFGGLGHKLGSDILLGHLAKPGEKSVTIVKIGFNKRDYDLYVDLRHGFSNVAQMVETRTN